VDTSLSGIEAVEKVKSGQKYDIIFMDHMMPKMDGIEATNIIRGMGYTKPIVALTANAVVGQAEIFLQNGIDAFIPKPIDTRQLNQILNKFIRDVQPPEVIEEARKRTREHIAQSTEAMGSPLTQSFLRDAAKTIDALESVYSNRDCYNEADVQNHVIHSHAIKSALANMGEATLSKRAAALEEWGRRSNMESIFMEIPIFLRDLRLYVEKITPKKEDTPAAESGLTDEERVKWGELRDACFAYNKKAARGLVSELNKMTLDGKRRDALDNISQHLLHSAFQEAGDAAEEAIKNFG
jgi:CheY-like chemotaxis protein/HPt (histidine-containing phosphotransfer) domain-containing protein